MAARGSSFGPEIFGFCRSGPGGSPGIVRFLKFRMYLHRSEGGGRDFRSLWPRVEARVSSGDLDFSGFYKLKSV